MSVTWSFYRFDYGRYLELRPSLRSATTPAAFASLADSVAIQAISEALLTGEIDLIEARHSFLSTTCCLGEPVHFGRTLTVVISRMARKRGGEEGAELLSELLAGGKNIESWLMPSSGLIGLLTPEQTNCLLASHLASQRAGRRKGGDSKKRKQGGLFPTMLSFFRSLLDKEPGEEEAQTLLFSLIQDATRRGEGIAVIAS